MNLYVARHGQSILNLQNKVCGITDAELTAKGIEQAERLAHAVKSLDINVILTSPLKRALNTSTIVGEICNIAVQIEPMLIEQNYGIYEGVERTNKCFLENKQQFAFKYPDGESQMQVAHRIYTLLDSLKENYADKNILLLSHGGVCRIIKTYFEDMTNDEFYHYTLHNCEIAKYHL